MDWFNYNIYQIIVNVINSLLCSKILITPFLIISLHSYCLVIITDAFAKPNALDWIILGFDYSWFLMGVAWAIKLYCRRFEDQDLEWPGILWAAAWGEGPSKGHESYRDHCPRLNFNHHFSLTGSSYQYQNYLNPLMWVDPHYLSTSRLFRPCSTSPYSSSSSNH